MWVLRAGDVVGAVLVFFGGRVGGEPGSLVFDELVSLFADVADGFEGQFAGDGVGGIVGWGLESGGPAVGGFDEFWGEICGCLGGGGRSRRGCRRARRRWR